ncbi:hypothetical protein C8R44DRAFT_726198 [Mycena epipterygia]|nr:hypothetical protein C8R44DRAFT_726198 [Mycena epipterygia]
MPIVDIYLNLVVEYDREHVKINHFGQSQSLCRQCNKSNVLRDERCGMGILLVDEHQVAAINKVGDTVEFEGRERLVIRSYRCIIENNSDGWVLRRLKWGGHNGNIAGVNSHICKSLKRDRGPAFGFFECVWELEITGVWEAGGVIGGVIVFLIHTKRENNMWTA